MVELPHVEPGDTVNAQLAVRETRGIKPYADGHLLVLILGNATGQITAKLWLGPSQDRARELAQTYDVGTVVNVHANVTEYKGRPELSLQEPPSTVDHDAIEPAAFVPGSNRHLGFLMRGVLERARAITDEDLRETVLQPWTDERTQNAIANAPASKRNHRAYRGGLLERVHALLSLTDTVCSVYPNLEEDLLTAAILLYPLGALEEHDVTTAIEITDEGRLLGPALLADQHAHERARDAMLSPDRAIRLRHALLVLNGAMMKVAPRTPEGVAARWIERLDANVTRTLEAVRRMQEDGEDAGWSPETKQYLDINARTTEKRTRSRSSPNGGEENQTLQRSK